MKGKLSNRHDVAIARINARQKIIIAVLILVISPIELATIQCLIALLSD